MPKICYLASPVTLPGSPTRRDDAYEHDLTIAAFRPAFAACGLSLEVHSWDAEGVDWSEYGLVIIGTTWDYWDRHDAFLARLAHIESQTILHNPLELVRWNSDKNYLRELAEMGCDIIPTLWFETLTQVCLEQGFAAFGNDLVIKRQIGAGAAGQFRVRTGDLLPETPHAMMVQPFWSSIQTEGEYSFIFIDGALSHALLKKAKSGDYRIQSCYGGFEQGITPNAEDLQSAQMVFDLLEPTPLYARIDMLRGQKGRLHLMEVELIEPYLYPEQGPDIGGLMANAVLRRLDNAS